MSDWYRGAKDIMFSDVFDGRLASYGIWEYLKASKDDKVASNDEYEWLWERLEAISDPNTRVLTDGDELLPVVRMKDGTADFVRRAGRSPFAILDKISLCFDTELIPDDDPRYYRVSTLEK